MDSLSYSVGVMLAQTLKQQGLHKIDASCVASGIEDALEGKDLQIGYQEANDLLKKHFEGVHNQQKNQNMAEGKKFLEENSRRDGVVSLPSGLQYEVLKEGDGPKPSATDKVTVHYQGSLISGKVFDSSIERQEPATFPVNGVIKGWVEALQLMKVGSKWMLFIPSDLAYGDRGAGPDIGPYATLIFEVELLKIN